MITPNKTFELKTLNSGYAYICGVDEVGMGCLAGPVVVCAVKVGKEFYEKGLVGIRDSKLLSESQREKLYKTLINEKSLSYRISLADSKKIDEINIYQASMWAMREAIKKVLGSSSQAIVLVDGNKKIPNLSYEQKTVVKGDQKVFAIACSSIIAKVYRDRMMKQYSKVYPNYGFEQHKGYSTILHQKQLNKLGPCPIHRRSFRLRY
ncbi:MAG: ribonuclease HII [Patescibacteria group bacterium]